MKQFKDYIPGWFSRPTKIIDAGVVRFVVEGCPVPWQRAGSVGIRRYTSAKLRAYENQVARLANEEARRLGLREANEGPWFLHVAAFYPDKRTRDNSNVLKAIEDACNGILWIDDTWTQLRDVRCVGMLDAKFPRTEVIAGKL